MNLKSKWEILTNFCGLLRKNCTLHSNDDLNSKTKEYGFDNRSFVKNLARLDSSLAEVIHSAYISFFEIIKTGFFVIRKVLIFRKLFCVQTKAPKSGNLSLKKIKHQFLKLFTFAFMWHGHFPARNGLKSRIVTQKTEPVNNISWLTQVFWVIILDFNSFLPGKLPSHIKAKLNIL